jgi:hypothetical protein
VQTRTLIRSIAAGAASLFLAAAVWAADANGKWNWTMRRGDNEVQQTLELKQDGEKLTGALLGRNDRKTEIKDGTIKNNELSFAVVRERNGQEFKTVYKGKLEGDTIKGTVTSTRNGEERSREWTATRAK